MKEKSKIQEIVEAKYPLVEKNPNKDGSFNSHAILRQMLIMELEDYVQSREREAVRAFANKVKSSIATGDFGYSQTYLTQPVQAGSRVLFTVMQLPSGRQTVSINPYQPSKREDIPAIIDGYEVRLDRSTSFSHNMGDSVAVIHLFTMVDEPLVSFTEGEEQ